LTEALVNGTDADFEALSDEGPIAVECYRAFCTGEIRIQFPGRSAQPFMDNEFALSSWLASHFPAPFLATFNNSRWIENDSVLCGLGYTGRADATPLLCQALRTSKSEWARMRAAISLGRLPGEDAEVIAALLEGLEDNEYLVQYHSIRSLGQIGDQAVLDRLLAIAADPSSYGIGITAPKVAANLAERLGVNVQVPRPDLSKWIPRNR
jgi:HEAT repeat protein